MAVPVLFQMALVVAAMRQKPPPGISRYHITRETLPRLLQLVCHAALLIVEPQDDQQRVGIWNSAAVAFTTGMTVTNHGKSVALV